MFAHSLLALALAATTALAALLPRQSPAPAGCSYSVCPADLNGDAPVGSTNDGIILVCTYPTAGETCTYAVVNGLLDSVIVNDPLCADIALESCPTPRRRYRVEDNFTVSRRKLAEKRAAADAAPLSNAMKARGALGKFKRDVRQ